jgi:hypothetical protein
MKRSRWFLAVVAMLVVGLSIAVYRAVRVSAEPATSAAAAPRRLPATGTESPEVSELRQELFRLRHQVYAQGQRLATDSSRPQAAAPAEPPGPEARAEAERKRKDYVAGIDAAFRKEVRDPQWSTATTSTVQSALAADDELRPLGRGVECRSQTCRVEITDDGSGSLGKLLPMFVHHVGPALPTMTADRVVDGSGGATMVLYLSRSTAFPATP